MGQGAPWQEPLRVSAWDLDSVRRQNHFLSSLRSGMEAVPWTWGGESLYPRPHSCRPQGSPHPIPVPLPHQHPGLFPGRQPDSWDTSFPAIPPWPG